MIGIGRKMIVCVCARARVCVCVCVCAGGRRGLSAHTLAVQVGSSELRARVDRFVREDGMHFIHPFDDLELMAGHSSCGREIHEARSRMHAHGCARTRTHAQDCADADVVLVCCGGGGLVGAVAAALRLADSKARIYAVEPETAPSMHRRCSQHAVLRCNLLYLVATGSAPLHDVRTLRSVVCCVTSQPR
jgi:threonine dehydratase